MSAFDAKRLRGFIRQSQRAHTAIEVLDVMEDLITRIDTAGDAAFERQCERWNEQVRKQKVRMLALMDRANAGITQEAP